MAQLVFLQYKSNRLISIMLMMLCALTLTGMTTFHWVRDGDLTPTEFDEIENPLPSRLDGATIAVGTQQAQQEDVLSTKETNQQVEKLGQQSNEERPAELVVPRKKRSLLLVHGKEKCWLLFASTVLATRVLIINSLFSCVLQLERQAA